MFKTSGEPLSPEEADLRKRFRIYAALVLKERRLELRLSQPALAELAGVNTNTIQVTEYMELGLTLATAYKLCRALLLPLDALTPPGLFPRPKAKRKPRRVKST